MSTIYIHITHSRYAGFALLALLMSCISLVATAQDERSLTRDGNKLFDKGKYADAEASYKKALGKNNNFPEAMFNLGDAMYKQERYDDAVSQYELAAKTFTDTKLKAQSFHNMGNCQLEKKEYEKAVDAYKQALKYNPADKDTKYNLAYANAKLKEKQKQDQQNKNNKNNKDQQNKDQKDKDKKDDKGNKDKKDDKGQKDKDKKDGQGQGDKDQKPQKGQPKLSKEQAEKLLEALKAEEQKAQDKMQKKTAKPVDVKVEKDW